MRELWSSKAGLGIALAIALLAATRVVYQISLVPPKLERDRLDLATASTRVLVDTPRSALVDLRQTTYDLTSLTNRAVLVGNVMASPPVREFIARRSGLEPEQIAMSPPLTPDQPRPLAGSAQEPSTTDILERPDGYRVSIEANPTAPVLDVEAVGPDPGTATRLADATVTGMEDYLDEVASAQGTPDDSRVSISALGEARGDVINPGSDRIVALLVFVATFFIASGAVLVVNRLRRSFGAGSPMGAEGSGT
jgi:hypothetical protein